MDAPLLCLIVVGFAGKIMLVADDVEKP